MGQKNKGDVSRGEEHHLLWAKPRSCGGRPAQTRKTGRKSPQFRQGSRGVARDNQHTVLTETLRLELRRPLSDSTFRHFFLHVDVVALCAANRDWTIAQIPDCEADLDQLICDGKTIRGSIEPTATGGSELIRAVASDWHEPQVM